MTSQAQVREIYLRVIDATIESLRADFTERSGGESALESLDFLKSRWVARLHTHEFTDDPALVENATSSASRNKKAANKAAKKKGAGAKDASAPGAANGSVLAANVKKSEDPIGETPPLPSVPRNVPSEEAKPEIKTEGKEEDSSAPPPAKRMRTEEKFVDDGQIENAAEDLDSDDSDDDQDDTDEEAENLVLALHERVRKGQKWKVNLKEGIVSIRGREYLFNKATCDLDF